MQSTSYEMPGWMNHKLELKLLGEIINNFIYADNTTLMAESKEELKSLLMKVKEESEKASLKLSIPKTKIMASGPNTSWQIQRGKLEVVTDFIFLGSKIKVDSNCSHEIKRRLLLGRKAMTNLDIILKSRDITLLTMVHIVTAMIFLVVMYGCQLDHKEGWGWRIDAFGLWWWRKLLRVPWTAKKLNQSLILKEINPEYSLEGLLLKLKLQYLGTWCEEPIHWKRPWTSERLKA